MPKLDSTSANIHLTNLTNMSANIAASSGTLNASSAMVLVSQMNGVMTILNNFIGASQSGIKISS